MGKYTSYSTQVEGPKKQREIHPIWRGIGFAMIILIPFLSYVGALAILEENARRGWFPIPRDLLVNYSDPMILIKALLTIAVAFVLYMVFMLITFIIYRMFGPSRYGPMDVPAESYRGKKHVR